MNIAPRYPEAATLVTLQQNREKSMATRLVAAFTDLGAIGKVEF